jgi:hypothetical protein
MSSPHCGSGASRHHVADEAAEKDGLPGIPASRRKTIRRLVRTTCTGGQAAWAGLIRERSPRIQARVDVNAVIIPVMPVPLAG